MKSPKGYKGRARQPGAGQGQRRNENGLPACPGNLELQLSTIYPSVSLLQKLCSIWTVPYVDIYFIFHTDLILIYFPILLPILMHLNC